MTDTKMIAQPQVPAPLPAGQAVGSWTSERQDDDYGEIYWAIHAASDYRFIANVYSAEKHARLIAAAPETLDELKKLYRAYVSLLELGRDRIVGLGGTCDAVDVMENGDPALASARATITKTEV